MYKIVCQRRDENKTSKVNVKLQKTQVIGTWLMIIEKNIKLK